MTRVAPDPAIEAAYRECERITKREAANFFYGIRLLPQDKRRAMCAAYAFARRIDDIGDGVVPLEQRLPALEREREGVADLRAGSPGDDAILVALSDADQQFDLPLEALEELIDGVEQDVRGTTYETFDELRGYCDNVAGSVGRLCVAIFGSSDPARALPIAGDLGVAMQLTNVIRDVLEDRDMGRVYLPAEDLRRFGCSDPLTGPDGAVERLIAFEAERARDWFARGLELLPLLDSRSSACVLAMTGIYRRILMRIEEDPLLVTRGRLSLPMREKVAIAARSLAGFGG
jgi:15-cis-phytoene synthase